MKFAAAASWVHKWLALVVGVQMLFWVVSGLFFAVVPIEQVRSERRIAQTQAAPLALSARSPADIAALLPESSTRLTFEQGLAGQAVAVAEFPERRPILINLEDWRVVPQRSDLWRIYDALWALYIMDWRDHENFNTGLLIAASLTALITVLAGFILFPYRMGWIRRRPAG